MSKLKQLKYLPCSWILTFMWGANKQETKMEDGQQVSRLHAWLIWTVILVFAPDHLLQVCWDMDLITVLQMIHYLIWLMHLFELYKTFGNTWPGGTFYWLCYALESSCIVRSIGLMWNEWKLIFTAGLRRIIYTHFRTFIISLYSPPQTDLDLKTKQFIHI